MGQPIINPYTGRIQNSNSQIVDGVTTGEVATWDKNLRCWKASTLASLPILDLISVGVNPYLTYDSVTGIFTLSIPDSSETVKGLIELATQVEVNTGIDDVRAVTPLKLTSFVNNYIGNIIRIFYIDSSLTPDNQVIFNSWETMYVKASQVLGPKLIYISGIYSPVVDTYDLTGMNIIGLNREYNSQARLNFTDGTILTVANNTAISFSRMFLTNENTTNNLFDLVGVNITMDRCWFGDGSGNQPFFSGIFNMDCNDTIGVTRLQTSSGNVRLKLFQNSDLSGITLVNTDGGDNIFIYPDSSSPYPSLGSFTGGYQVNLLDTASKTSFINSGNPFTTEALTVQTAIDELGTKVDLAIPILKQKYTITDADFVLAQPTDVEYTTSPLFQIPIGYSIDKIIITLNTPIEVTSGTSESIQVFCESNVLETQDVISGGSLDSQASGFKTTSTNFDLITKNQIDTTSNITVKLILDQTFADITQYPSIDIIIYSLKV